MLLVPFYIVVIVFKSLIYLKNKPNANDNVILIKIQILSYLDC